MKVFEAIQQRASVRSYTDEPVAREHLELMLEAARLAPSGYNKQPWHFLVLVEKDDIAAVGEALKSDWVGRAPALIVVTMDPSSHFWLEDGAASTENILLTATSLGYGSCWVGGGAQFNEEELRRVLGVPQERKIQAVITVGKADKWNHHDKKSLREIVTWGRWPNHE